MVNYEVALTVRSMAKPEMVASLKRICTTIMQNGSIIKNIENLGDSKLAYKISAHNERFQTGRYGTIDYLFIEQLHPKEDVDVTPILSAPFYSDNFLCPPLSYLTSLDITFAWQNALWSHPHLAMFSEQYYCQYYCRTPAISNQY